MLRLLGLLVIAALMSGCSALHLGSVATPMPAATTAPVPQAIPDGPEAETSSVGDEVTIGDGTLTYLGTTSRPAGLVSWFAVDGAVPGGGILITPDGERTDLVADGSRLRSAPWAGSPTAAGREFTIVFDRALAMFRVGPISEGEGPPPST